jgi:hypothetical protein
MAKGNPGDMIGLKGKLWSKRRKQNKTEMIGNWYRRPSGAWRKSEGIQRGLIGCTPGMCSPEAVVDLTGVSGAGNGKGYLKGALPATTKTTNTTQNHKNTHKTTKTINNHQNLMVRGEPGAGWGGGGRGGGGGHEKPTKPPTTTNKQQNHQNQQKPPKTDGNFRKWQGATPEI